MSEQYPNSIEIREWGMARRPDLISSRGALPKFLIVAWNRAHPDRPYVASEAYHGTTSGYWSRSCRCERCVTAGNAYERNRYAARSAERNDDLADELLDGDR